MPNEYLNLIRDSWIPTRHHSGHQARRPLWDIVGPADDPATALATTRPDFDGALTELMIGLLQVAMPPADHDAWLARFETPPTPDELRDHLAPLAPAFELFGAGPRYQQDPRVDAFGGKPLPAEKMLIDLGMSPGADVFSRNGSVGALCLPCAAAALTTMQTYAPSGGRGNLTSLRGGGPMTTLVAPADDNGPFPLWKKLWLNVLPLDALGMPPPSTDALEKIFPWVATQSDREPTRALELTPEEAHPLQAFFGMPRRMWLTTPQDEVGDCGLCGGGSTPVVTAIPSPPPMAFATPAPGSTHCLPTGDSRKCSGWRPRVMPRALATATGWA